MANSNQVKLYGMWASAPARRVEWALKMKGISYQYIEEDLFNKSSSLLEFNPINKQVPVLVHDGRPIVESLVILEYLDEVWNEKPILPKDPYERAKARFWATLVDDKCRAATKVAFTAEGEEKAKAIETIEEVIARLDNELKGKKFFGGDEIGYLDLAAGWMAFWLPVQEEVACFQVVDSDKFPNFCSWIENFLGDSVIEENLPSFDKTIEVFKNYRMHLLARFE